jgi:poly(3-hydroxybutyrate) depolymerase
MLKKSVATLFAGALLAFTGLTVVAHAATVSNGAACAKSGATSTVKVKGLSKTYSCHTNPSVAGATMPTWTLKTCLSYWAAAQNSQDSIDQQRSLVGSMSEPDKTNYNKQLDASQVQLNKVKAVIVSNHCKKGL